jgi:hypothetical protein
VGLWKRICDIDEDGVVTAVLRERGVAEAVERCIGRWLGDDEGDDRDETEAEWFMPSPITP